MNHKKTCCSYCWWNGHLYAQKLPPRWCNICRYGIWFITPQRRSPPCFPHGVSFKRFRNTLQKTQLPTLKASCELEVCFRKVCFWCFFFNRKMEGINLYKNTPYFSVPLGFFFRTFLARWFCLDFVVFGKRMEIFRSFQLHLHLGGNQPCGKPAPLEFFHAFRRPWFLSVSPSSGLGVLVGSVGEGNVRSTCFLYCMVHRVRVNRRLWTALNFFWKVGVFLMGAKRWSLNLEERLVLMSFSFSLAGLTWIRASESDSSRSQGFHCMTG